MHTRHMNTSIFFKHGLPFIGAALLLVLVLTGAMTPPEASQEQKKQLKFPHQFHVKEAGIACTDCHGSAATSTQASDNLFAKKAACQNCHEDQLKDNCTYCHTSSDAATYASTPNPIRDLQFSHKQHIENQKVTCETCHTVLDKADAPTGTLVPAMASCMSCHNAVKTTAACELCHTNFADLRPRDHNSTDFIHEHKRTARMADASCGTCHSQEICLDCHNGSDLVKVDVPGRDLVSQHSPRLGAIDRGQGLRLAKVHNLNFRFTHGIAARSKETECQTCHTAKDFCTTCHEAGGNINQGAIRPASHMAAGFKTLGVGSGGGEHARLAKRDIESCAMCHASDGADPVCITCHMDADGIKGTNPKTHDRGFMSSDHGIWHSDPGANCYVCHTDINANPSGRKGQKFCGYCHR